MILPKNSSPDVLMLRFLKRARAPRHFSLKGHPMRKLLIFTGAFQGHQGNDQGAWRKLPLLPPACTWCILFNRQTKKQNQVHLPLHSPKHMSTLMAHSPDLTVTLIDAASVKKHTSSGSTKQEYFPLHH